MTTFGERLIESATEAVTMVKLMRENKDLKDRIEQLEQALVDLGVEHCIALNNLSEEKALTYRLTDRAEKAEIDAEFFKGEVKVRNRIPSTNDTASDLYKRIEQLERELAECRSDRAEWMQAIEQANKNGKQYDALQADLAAEKALADLLDRELSDAKDTATAQYKGSLYPENADGWEMCVNDMLCIIEVGRAAYRKARGL